MSNPENKKFRPKSPDAGRLDPRLRRIRAMKMLELKLFHNYSRQEIAEEFRLSKMTIDRELSWAKRADLFVQLEDRLLAELAPAAMDRLVREMRNEDGTVNMDGDANIAAKLLDAAGFGKKEKKDGVSTGDTLEVYIQRKRELAAQREQSVDGQLLGSPPVAGYLPSASGDQPTETPIADAPVGIPLGGSHVAQALTAPAVDSDGEVDLVDGSDAT